MKYTVHILFLTVLMMLSCCAGQDRSGEQPFKPTVQTQSAVAGGDSCVMTGVVTASPNSPLTECGFSYGNDTLHLKATLKPAVTPFTETIDSLKAGRYYTVAYATNGMGTSYGDTLYFEIP